MFCVQCGRSLDESERFCRGCGRVTDKFGGFWKRLSAFVLDFVVVQAAGLIAGVGLGFLISITDPHAFESEAASQATQARLTPLLIVIFQTLLWLYYALMESSRKQATLGKLALGIKVIDQDGHRITFWRSTARHFAKILSIILAGFGFFMISITDRSQGLHDLISKCLVVNR